MQKIVGPHRDSNLSPAWHMDQATQHDWLVCEVFVNASATTTLL